MLVSLTALEQIPISLLFLPKYQLRSETSRREISSLADSIERNGLLEPLVVRRISNGYELIAGCRRLRALRQLGHKTAICHIVEANDQQAFEISIVENVQHQNLNPIDEAIAYRRYIEEFGYGGITDLAAKISKSQEYVSLRLALLKMPKDITDRIISRQISPSTAQELLPLTMDQQRRLSNLIVERKLTKREVRQAVKAIKKEDFEGIDWLSSKPNIQTASQQWLEQSCLRNTVLILDKTLQKLDEILKTVPTPSVLEEMLREYKSQLQNQIDRLTRLERTILTQSDVEITSHQTICAMK